MNRYKKITFYNSKFKIQNSKFKIQNWLRRNAFQNWLTPKCVSKLADAELRFKIGCAEPFLFLTSHSPLFEPRMTRISRIIRPAHFDYTEAALRRRMARKPAAISSCVVSVVLIS
jgi:hypothetical protein